MHPSAVVLCVLFPFPLAMALAIQSYKKKKREKKAKKEHQRHAAEAEAARVAAEKKADAARVAAEWEAEQERRKRNEEITFGRHSVLYGRKVQYIDMTSTPICEVGEPIKVFPPQEQTGFDFSKEEVNLEKFWKYFSKMSPAELENPTEEVSTALQILGDYFMTKYREDCWVFKIW